MGFGILPEIMLTYQENLETRNAESFVCSPNSILEGFRMANYKIHGVLKNTPANFLLKIPLASDLFENIIFIFLDHDCQPFYFSWAEINSQHCPLHDYKQ